MWCTENLRLTSLSTIQFCLVAEVTPSGAITSRPAQTALHDVLNVVFIALTLQLFFSQKRLNYEALTESKQRTRTKKRSKQKTRAEGLECERLRVDIFCFFLVLEATWLHASCCYEGPTNSAASRIVSWTWGRLCLACQNKLLDALTTVLLSLASVNGGAWHGFSHKDVSYLL